MAMAADADGVEWIQPFVIGIAEPIWCIIDGTREGASRITISCWGRNSETIMKPMGRPVASGNWKFSGRVRCLLAFGVNDGMRFQKLCSWEGSFAPWMKAYEGWN